MTTASPVRSIPDYTPPADRTLAMPAAEWITRYLTDPEDPRKPFTLTREQFRMLARWYEIDGTGRFVHRRGAIRRMRGWGKSPFLAVLCALEFLGPCRFGGWDEAGSPTAVPVQTPLVQLCAVNLSQTAAVMDMFAVLFSGRAIEEYGLDIGKEFIYRLGPGKIQTIANSPRSLRGARATFYCLDETSEWVSTTSGHAMMERIRGNLAKSREGAARALEICNAFVPGEDSVAERTYEAWVRSTSGAANTAADIYYDALEAPAATDMNDVDSLRHGLRCARGDSTWLDIERFVREIWDGDTAPSLARRDYLNQITAAEDALVRIHKWDDNADESLSLQDGDVIAMGLDPSLTDDSTGLVACRISDRAMFVLHLQERNASDRTWQLDTEYLSGAVADAFRRFKVVAFYSDYHPLETYVDSWADMYREDVILKASVKSAIAYDMRSSHKAVSVGVERLIDGINHGHVLHDGNRFLRQHLMNARRRLNKFGQLSFSKETPESPRKVDLVAAMLLADMARHDYVASGKGLGPQRGMIVLR